MKFTMKLRPQVYTAFQITTVGVLSPNKGLFAININIDLQGYLQMDRKITFGTSSTQDERQSIYNL